MRICLVGPAYPYRGGISHYSAMLAREMRASHDVLLVNFSRLYPDFLFPGRTQYDEGTPALGVESKRLIDSINPLSWRRAADAVCDFNPDIVVFQWWQPFFAPAYRSMCGRIHARTKARIVYVCHNVLPHESSPVDRALTKLAFSDVDGFVVQSREDGRILSALRPGARVEFNPMPVFDLFAAAVDPARSDALRRELALEGRVILFFGLVRAYKGLRTLLEAFALEAEPLEATLLVVGEFYEDREPYDEAIRQLGIVERVRIVDRYVPDADVPAYFGVADVVVLPYVSATQSAIVQTAFSFERPVIVTAVGGLPDVVRDGATGYVVPPQNPRALADAMLRFYRDDAGPRMSAAIREHAGDFAWSRCVDAIISASSHK
ncbi:MAG TPA: glycosyltransferase [Candidatus Krumholzibacteria bacterium]